MIGWWYVFQCLRFFNVGFLNWRFETILWWSLSLRFVSKSRFFLWFTGLVFYLLSNTSNPKGAKFFMMFILISMTVTMILLSFFDYPIFSRSWDRIISILRTYSWNWELIWTWFFTFIDLSYFRDWSLYFLVDCWFLNT